MCQYARSVCRYWLNEACKSQLFSHGFINRTVAAAGFNTFWYMMCTLSNTPPSEQKVHNKSSTMFFLLYFCWYFCLWLDSLLHVLLLISSAVQILKLSACSTPLGCTGNHVQPAWRSKKSLGKVFFTLIRAGSNSGLIRQQRIMLFCVRYPFLSAVLY